MIFDSLGVSLIYGTLKKGKISGIADIEIKKPSLFIAAFVLEFGMLNFSNKFYGVIKYQSYIHFFVYLLLFIGLWYNRNNKYFRIISVGVFLNFIVIFANGGRMPVSIDALKAAGLNNLILQLQANRIATHQVLKSSTRLKFLADVLVLPKPYPLPKAFSIGDFIMATGTFLLVTNAMLKKVKSHDGTR
ncbi:conserved hypothetical protein [Thermoanaerobacter mathranii subsp. mathranii str. A3]|uniref:DUF5317 domain-containing protein n=3 Tax=Thermoanaerobacter TaxID=1754 RepID=D3T785_THEIA|nr:MULTISPECIES: DUF5317 domain-containing protein [Thermoanaerobacter]ADD01817.1 conserved hypothetical protein [Thermoanaerobacter italicus Ab9]ADH60337.1 conserved hypothetical protein [Thermoanaerobacter mathranii subsp. mathranii str. A3]MDP9750583.1 hypothetical protein [Thermoanaerobacter pentosaceus]